MTIPQAGMAPDKATELPQVEADVLVLQGGGALGAYQAGAFEALARAGRDIRWVAGISIGAINAAIICGNPEELRVERLAAFWDMVSVGLTTPLWADAAWSRDIIARMASATAVMTGVSGFFRPRFPWAGVSAAGVLTGTSYYDTSPLRETLTRLIDFDYLNEEGPRLSVGAVDVETGNFTYFDSRHTRINPEHIMASGALPPGFPAVEIDGRHYWDGGLVSNTPLQYVLENAGSNPLCVFQVDLFSAQGANPTSLDAVGQREKDIRYSSRTRLTTDRFRQLNGIREAAQRLAAKLPEEFRDDSDLAQLLASGPACPVTLLHLIHRKEFFESVSKDYEFSRISMQQHWDAGTKDVMRSLDHELWRNRRIAADGLQVFDLSRKLSAT